MGSGFRTFASGEVLTSSNVQNYLMDQAVMVFAGTAARASALPSPEVGMTAYSTATGLQVYNGTAWVNVSTGYGAGTGGSGTAVGTAIGGFTYNVHTFSSDANFVITSPGLFDVLLVGGGGGAGSSNQSYSSGGGGAGALVGFATTTTIYLAAGTVAIDIGAGGAGNFEGAGFASYIGSVISAAGGGPGGNGQDYTVGGEATRAFNVPGRNGGSGGGGGATAGATQVGLSIDETFGNDGGTSNASTNGGGGGGYSAVGGNGNSTTGGSGGNGVNVSSWGTSGSTDNIAAGGGGGGSGTGGAAGTGGVAGVTSGTGNAATTAGSGGGGTHSAGALGGAGAAGKVWIRYRT